MNDSIKPKCKLTGTDGNAFSIIGNVSKTLKRAGLKDEAKEFTDRAFKCESYEELIGKLIYEYVDVS